MRIKELIDQLQQFDPETEIQLGSGSKLEVLTDEHGVYIPVP